MPRCPVPALNQCPQYTVIWRTEVVTDGPGAARRRYGHAAQDTAECIWPIRARDGAPDLPVPMFDQGLGFNGTEGPVISHRPGIGGRRSGHAVQRHAGTRRGRILQRAPGFAVPVLDQSSVPAGANGPDIAARQGGQPGQSGRGRRATPRRDGHHLPVLAIPVLDERVVIGLATLAHRPHVARGYGGYRVEEIARLGSTWTHGAHLSPPATVPVLDQRRHPI